ncbi:DsrE family protein [Costertonia aggregata]|uniref:DsrE family protein n=1 Tax=Costertonia aggregata TaxID=343403 RepID=A0A7H9ATT0_9FLAO|nr:DsrE family protein [Costertonia aggregata]QLG46878.1 DsrE family protein [Costertonia aggregata]
MKKNLSHSFVFLFLCTVTNGFSQNKSAGPVIESFGKVWAIENLTFKTDTTKVFKIVFDIMDSPLSYSELNRSIETAARFLNMHAQAGVPKENLKVALVVHNKASKDILSNAAYEKRYLTQNPNSDMIKELLAADVDFILCGQSSLSRKFPIDEAIDGVQMALSAMTAIMQLQDDGYRLIKF